MDMLEKTAIRWTAVISVICLALAALTGHPAGVGLVLLLWWGLLHVVILWNVIKIIDYVIRR